MLPVNLICCLTDLSSMQYSNVIKLNTKQSRLKVFNLEVFCDKLPISLKCKMSQRNKKITRNSSRQFLYSILNALNQKQHVHSKNSLKMILLKYLCLFCIYSFSLHKLLEKESIYLTMTVYRLLSCIYNSVC